MVRQPSGAFLDLLLDYSANTSKLSSYTLRLHSAEMPGQFGSETLIWFDNLLTMAYNYKKSTTIEKIYNNDTNTINQTLNIPYGCRDTSLRTLPTFNDHRY